MIVNTKTTSFQKQALFKQAALSETSLQIVLGSLLGDGSLRIQKNYKNARFQIRHGIVQEKYITWKHKKLEEIVLEKLQIGEGSGFSSNKMINLQSKALPSLTVIHTIVCKNNRLEIDRSWLYSIKELALLVWWLDDGSLVSNGRRGCFCTDNFSIDKQETLRNYLFERWNIALSIGNVTDGKYKRLYLNNNELKKLFLIIMPFLEVEDMVRKFAIRYKKKEDKERWISIMKSAMPRFHNEIERVYSTDL